MNKFVVKMMVALSLVSFVSVASFAVDPNAPAFPAAKNESAPAVDKKSEANKEVKPESDKPAQGKAKPAAKSKSQKKSKPAKKAAKATPAAQ